MARTDYASIEDYLATQPPKTRKVLERVRRALGRAIPRATERISYRIPALSVDGVAVIYFAGWTDHYAVYPVGERVPAALGEQIAPYRASKGTLRFALDEAVPEPLLAAIARLRAEEVADIVAARRARKAAQKLQNAASQKSPETTTTKAARAATKKAAKAATKKVAKAATKKPAKAATKKVARAATKKAARAATTKAAKAATTKVAKPKTKKA